MTFRNGHTKSITFNSPFRFYSSLHLIFLSIQRFSTSYTAITSHGNNIRYYWQTFLITRTYALKNIHF